MTLPALNPIEAPDLVCTTCGEKMRREIVKHKSTGRLEKIVYYCDTEKCQYGMSITLAHMNAQAAPYVPAPAPVPLGIARPVVSEAGEDDETDGDSLLPDD